MNVSPQFIRNITTTFPGGGAWLQALPALLADCAVRYDLTMAPTPFDLSFNYVTPAVRNRDGREVVLKLGVPRPDGITSEIGALRIWNGKAVRLLEADEVRGVLLMERLRPGTMLSDLWNEDRDDEVTEAAARVMRDLWPAPEEEAELLRAGSPPFASVSDWERTLGEVRPETCPPGLLPQIAHAKALFAELGADTAPTDIVLLHGDLHPLNILRDGTSWKAIDPHGVWGDRAYEAGAYLRTPWPGLFEHPSPQALTSRRLDIFADVQCLPREKLRLWALASAVLTAWWHVDSSLPNGGDNWQHSARCAELLREA